MRAIKGSITVLGWGEWEVGRDAGDTDRPVRDSPPFLANQNKEQSPKHVLELCKMEAYVPRVIISLCKSLCSRVMMEVRFRCLLLLFH